MSSRLTKLDLRVLAALADAQQMAAPGSDGWVSVEDLACWCLRSHSMTAQRKVCRSLKRLKNLGLAKDCPRS